MYATQNTLKTPGIAYFIKLKEQRCPEQFSLYTTAKVRVKTMENNFQFVNHIRSSFFHNKHNMAPNLNVFKMSS